jgi:hypothetical protein
MEGKKSLEEEENPLFLLNFKFLLIVVFGL